MVEIRTSRPEEMEAQKALWHSAFGDEPRYIDWFYQCCGRPESLLVLLEDGKLASMLALLPQTLMLSGGERASACYIYALATDPAARSRGYGRQLLCHVDTYVKGLGVDCATVVPAEPSLFKFFGTVNFAPCFATRKLELLRDMVGKDAGGACARKVEPEEYNRLRDAQLDGLPGVRYGEELIRYQQGLCRMSGGGLYRVEVDGQAGCAAAEYVDEGSVLFKELLIAPDKMARAVAALAQQLPGVRYHVRTPAGWDGLPGSYIQPFGMIKWYNEEKRQQWGQDSKGYMGLGFD